MLRFWADYQWRLSLCPRSKSLALWVVFISLFFHAVIVLINYTILEALGANVSLVYCFLVIPIILFITLLPVFINGLGHRGGPLSLHFAPLKFLFEPSGVEALAGSLT